MVGAVAFLATFAALWAVAALHLAGLPWLAAIGPAMLSVALIGYARTVAARLPPRDAAEERRVGRLIKLWSAVEGVAIFVAANVVLNLGRPDLLVAAVALVVGLHFLPLARGLPQPVYWLSGGTLIALAGAGLAAPVQVPAAVVASGAAAILWLTALQRLAQARTAASAAAAVVD